MRLIETRSTQLTSELNYVRLPEAKPASKILPRLMLKVNPLRSALWRWWAVY